MLVRPVYACGSYILLYSYRNAVAGGFAFKKNVHRARGATVDRKPFFGGKLHMYICSYGHHTHTHVFGFVERIQSAYSIATYMNIGISVHFPFAIWFCSLLKYIRFALRFHAEHSLSS